MEEGPLRGDAGEGHKRTSLWRRDSPLSQAGHAISWEVFLKFVCIGLLSACMSV